MKHYLNNKDNKIINARGEEVDISEYPEMCAMNKALKKMNEYTYSHNKQVFSGVEVAK